VFLGLKNNFSEFQGHTPGAQERKGMDGVFAASAIGRDDYGGFLVLNILCLICASFPD
jgi:hypothetical protein